MWIQTRTTRYDLTPVITLALDTTTRGGSVAVVRDDKTVVVIEGDAARTYGERLPSEIEQALASSGLAARDLELLVVAIGPGAFTGLRIGLAAIQGLAMVTGTPVVGVSALDALAAAAWPLIAPSEPVVTWMDAQRGEVFSAHYRHAPPCHDFPWQHAGLPVVGLPESLLSQSVNALGESLAFIGDGAVRYHSLITNAATRRVLPMPHALAPALAQIGQRLARCGAAGPPHALQPLYVRRPDAELDRLSRQQS